VSVDINTRRYWLNAQPVAVSLLGPVQSTYGLLEPAPPWKLVDEERSVTIVVTVNALQSDGEACLVAGIDNYIAKPVRVEELVDTWMKACFSSNAQSKRK